MDDFEVLTQIKAQDKMISVLMVTAHGKSHDAARLLHIDYKTMHCKLKLHQISSTPFTKDIYKTTEH